MSESVLWQARPPHSDWRLIAPEHVDDYRAKDWEVRPMPAPAQAGKVTDAMIEAAVEAAWPGPEIVYDDNFGSAEAMMKAALEAALAAQPPAAPVETGNAHNCECSLCAELRSDVEKLKDPVAVHINMLRGGIAKPIWANIKHLYPEHFQCSAGSEGEPFMMLSCREAKQCLHNIPGCICDGDPTNG